MNLFALVFILLIGIFTDWGNAFWALAGYLFAWIVVGAMRSRGSL